MIIKNINEDKPDNFLIEKIEGDKAYYYFKSDNEVLDGIKRSEQHKKNEIRNDKKLIRNIDIIKLTISTKSGNKYNANTESQNAMARNILVMNDTDYINWVLADNSVIEVSKAELTEALRLAVKAQSDIWVLTP